MNSEIENIKEQTNQMVCQLFHILKTSKTRATNEKTNAAKIELYPHHLKQRTTRNEGKQQKREHQPCLCVAQNWTLTGIKDPRKTQDGTEKPMHEAD